MSYDLYLTAEISALDCPEELAKALAFMGMTRIGGNMFSGKICARNLTAFVFHSGDRDLRSEIPEEFWNCDKNSEAFDRCGFWRTDTAKGFAQWLAISGRTQQSEELLANIAELEKFNPWYHLTESY